VNKRIGLIVLVVSLFIVSGVNAGEQDLNHQVQALSTHDITMDASSYKAFPVYCQSGNTLSGEFVVKHDGELYPGDQTEYDLSLLTGIDFVILDEENYEFWIQDESATPIFEMRTLVQLEWSVEVPHEGLWYVVYVNDSIYMKRIEGSIVHPGMGDAWLIAFVIIGGIPIVGTVYLLLKKRGKAVAA
jgi:hypothetical protein